MLAAPPHRRLLPGQYTPFQQVVPMIGIIPHGSGLDVIELPVARFDQWHHTGKPLAKLRQGKDLGYTTLPLGQAVHRCLRDDCVERATGIREDAIPILAGPMLSGLFEEYYQFASLAIFGLEDVSYEYHAFTSFRLK